MLDDKFVISLMEDDNAWLTRDLRGLAGQLADGRIVSILEGSYEPGALACSVGGAPQGVAVGGLNLSLT